MSPVPLFLLFLQSLLMVFGAGNSFRPNPLRAACMRTGRFETPHKDYALVNHVVATHKVTCPLDCTHACLEDNRCISFNYQYATTYVTHQCELNDHVNTSSPVDYVARANFSYYKPLMSESGIGLACSSDPCLHGGRCIDSCGLVDGFYCECRKDYMGKYCNIHSKVKNCQELKKLGATENGLYDIDPDGKGLIRVYCDQTTGSGGWAVFQRRISPFGTSFNRGWEEYRVGFGDLKGEFWLGNDNIHRITANGVKFRVDLRESGGKAGKATYTGFVIAGSADKYSWTMTSYSGNIGNSIYGASWHYHNVRGMKFSTPDQDNDNCPNHCSGSSGSWQNWCGDVDLNAVTRPYWSFWEYSSTVIFSEMKVRPE